MVSTVHELSVMRVSFRTRALMKDPLNQSWRLLLRWKEQLTK